jgi:hypothetical protein
MILNRAPTISPTALLAFHPVRVAGDAIHLHPLLCKWLDADFDGDQAAMHLPVTEVAQREAGERLSVAAHLNRDPGLLSDLLPALDMLWGLSRLSLRPEGLQEIETVVGESIATSSGFISQDALADAMHKVLAREGISATLTILERLMVLGLDAAKASGASLNPFAETKVELPQLPLGDNPDAWTMYTESVAETLVANADYTNHNLGPQLLMVKARGTGLQPLRMLVAGRGEVQDVNGDAVIVRHGYAEGYTPEEMFACVAGARRGLAEVWRGWRRMGQTFRERNVSRSFNVLTRALRAKHPGLVFARAAANEEVDPLTDVESRLLVGVPV